MLTRGISIDDIKLKGLSYSELKSIFTQDIILAGYVGSIAHGTYILQTNPAGIDDKDVMFVYIKEKPYYLGLGGGKDTRAYMVKEWDMVGYEIRKYIHLLLKSNPNVMSLLWLPSRCYIAGSNIGWMLKDQRDIFVSKKAYHSFTGYAYGQLKRMEHFKFEGYMGEKRKGLVDKFGYDTKNAAHLIRLLRMGIEFLTEGKLFVEREDACQLVDIKQGAWTLERVKEEADTLFHQANEAYIHSPLPDEPDYNKAEKLLINILAYYHNLEKVDWHQICEDKEVG
jgi:uncharacterized protein